MASYLEKAAHLYYSVISSESVVVADIETSGLSSFSEILEIGAVRINLKKRITEEKFSRFIKPRLIKHIPEKITALTGITDEMVADAASAEEVLGEFHAFIGACPIAFHNATFDWSRFLSKDLLGIGKQVGNPIIDTLPTAKYLFPEWEGHKLNNLCDHYKNPIVGHHRALVDAGYTAYIMLAMMRDLQGRIDPTWPAAPSQDDVMARTTAMAADIDLASMKLYKVNFWNQGKGKQRIYVTTSAAKAYYDLTFHVWRVEDISAVGSIDLHSFSEKIFSMVGVADIGQFVEKYQK